VVHMTVIVLQRRLLLAPAAEATSSDRSEAPACCSRCCCLRRAGPASACVFEHRLPARAGRTEGLALVGVARVSALLEQASDRFDVVDYVAGLAAARAQAVVSADHSGSCQLAEAAAGPDRNVHGPADVLAPRTVAVPQHRARHDLAAA